MKSVFVSIVGNGMRIHIVKTSSLNNGKGLSMCGRSIDIDKPWLAASRNFKKMCADCLHIQQREG